MAQGKEFRPTGAMRRRVQTLIAGMSEDDIALALGISRGCLRKHFTAELRTGRQVVIAEALVAARKQAKKGSVPAIRLLLTKGEAMAAEAAFVAPEVVKTVRPPKLGKKEQAAEAASTAGVGTDWGNDLDPARPN